VSFGRRTSWTNATPSRILSASKRRRFSSERASREWRRPYVHGLVSTKTGSLPPSDQRQKRSIARFAAIA